MTKKKRPNRTAGNRTKDGKFKPQKTPEDELAEWFRRENERTQTEGVCEWESSNESDSKRK